MMYAGFFIYDRLILMLVFREPTQVLYVVVRVLIRIKNGIAIYGWRRVVKTTGST